MGEHFERQRTKRFIELADMDCQRQLNDLRLRFQNLGAYQTSYRCEPNAHGVSASQVRPGDLVMVSNEGGQWLILFHNQVLGYVAPEGASDLSAKASGSDVALVLTAEIESVSTLSGNFKIRLRAEEEAAPKAPRNPKKVGKKHGN